MDHHATNSHSHDQHGDHGGLGKYMVVFVCLCGLTACSFMTLSEWWPFEKTPTWIFMMGVSSMKAMLVILFFMHLLWEANWKYVLTIPAAMMSVFMVLMFIPDVGCRMQKYSEERIVYAAEPEAIEQLAHGEAHAGGEHAEHAEHAADHADDHAPEGEH